MRSALILLPLAALAACSTPREQCIAAVTQDTRILSSLINETQANLSRGYALEERQDVRTVTRSCRATNEEEEVIFFPCQETETFTTTRPVAIDLVAEQAKLSSLEQKFAVSQEASNQAVAQCIEVHPE